MPKQLSFPIVPSEFLHTPSQPPGSQFPGIAGQSGSGVGEVVGFTVIGKGVGVYSGELLGGGVG